MIDEPVHLEKYNPSWTKYFDRERERLMTALELDSKVIEHIGSTAIKNIRAKPIIDIAVGVEIYPPPQHLIDRLIDLGYEALGEADVPKRLYFRYRQIRSFNVHIVELNGRHWKSNLAFRDYLIAHPEEAKRYEEIKVKAIQSGSTSLLKYSIAKSAIVGELTLLAQSQQTDK